MTSVPDFKTCRSQRECRDLADQYKVKVRWELRGEPFAPFEVLDFNPPKGAPVPEGSIITIFRPPTLANALASRVVATDGSVSQSATY